MSTYQQQLAKCKDTTDDYSNIWKSSVWTINDYEELFKDIDRGYIIQDPEDIYFIINPDWEEEEEEEEQYCEWLRLKDIDCGDDKTLEEFKAMKTLCEHDRCETVGLCSLDKCFFETE